MSKNNHLSEDYKNFPQYLILSQRGKDVMDGLLKILNPTSITKQQVQSVINIFANLVSKDSQNIEEQQRETISLIIEIFGCEESAEFYKKISQLAEQEKSYLKLLSSSSDTALDKYLEILDESQRLKLNYGDFSRHQEMIAILDEALSKDQLQGSSFLPRSAAIFEFLADLASTPETYPAVTPERIAFESANLLLGYCYEHGIGVEKSIRLACDCYITASHGDEGVEYLPGEWCKTDVTIKAEEMMFILVGIKTDDTQIDSEECDSDTDKNPANVNAVAIELLRPIMLELESGSSSDSKRPARKSFCKHQYELDDVVEAANATPPKSLTPTSNTQFSPNLMKTPNAI
ncbi:MAG: SEL1-like repeat protein [Pseudomonadota bacterium]